MRQALVFTIALLFGLTTNADAAPGVKPPPPAAAVTVLHQPCPEDPDLGGGSCIDVAAATIYLAPGSDRWDRQHELGHWTDYTMLTFGERNRFRTLIGRPRLPWVLPGLIVVDASELFADAYAACRIGMDPARGWIVTVGPGHIEYAPSGHVHRKVCGFIVRAMRDAGTPWRPDGLG